MRKQLRRLRLRAALIVLAAQAVFIAAVLAGPAGGRPPERSAPQPERAVPGELIVAFKPGVAAGKQRKALALASAHEQRRFDRIDSLLVSVGTRSVEAAIRRLERDPAVRYAEPNFLLSADTHGGTPNDPALHQLWGLDNFGQTVDGVAGVPDADIDAREAWAVSTGSSEVVVGVIDTGVDFGHPDLAANMWVNNGEDCSGCRTNGLDDDGNGYVDDWRGWDFVNDDNNPFDDAGHGTHVAGTIGAAGDNGIGIAGVSWTVRLLALKFLSASGTGSTADAISAILYASAKGAPVTNNSWGGEDYSQALRDAVAAADASGSLFVAAAGNSFTDTDASPSYPSSFELPNVVSVAATDAADGRAWFSNYGRRTVDLGAPGMNVYSTWPGGSYRFQDGTSMAAPHVAGAAALAKAAFPSATGAGLKALLLRTVDPVSALGGATTTGGRLNADTALRCSAPQVWIDSPRPPYELVAGDPVTVEVLAARCGDPAGVSVSAEANGAPLALTARGDGLYTASFTPSAGGPVTISAAAAAGGATDMQTVSGMAIRSYAIAPGGSPVTVTTTAPGENARLVFDGLAGQRVSLKASGVTIGTSTCCSLKLSIARPDGTSLFPPTLMGTNGGFVDTRTLPADGSYSILVDPQNAGSGSATLTLYDVPPDVSGTIVAGGAAAAVSIGPVPGQNARLSFEGTAGSRISLRVGGVTIGSSTCCGLNVSIWKPDGTNLVFPTLMGTNGGFLDARTLPVSGTYSVLVDPQGTGLGDATLTLYDVPPDVGGTIAAGGAAVTVGIGPVPGQNARLSFQGVAGRRVSLRASGVTIGSSTCCSLNLSIAKPDGTNLATPMLMGTNGGFLDMRTLPVSGTYSILVDPQATATGSATLTLYDVPPDVAASIAPGGPAVTVSIGPVPGQNATLTFAGTAGQRISLRAGSVSIGTSSCCSARLSISKPDGSALVPPTLMGTGGGFLDTQTLAVSGTYSILVDPQGTDLGSATLTLFDVPPDVSGTIAVGGSPVSLTLGPVPGQNARLTFAGTAGQRISLRLSSVTIGTSSCCSARVSIAKPDGTNLVPPTLVGTMGGTLTPQLPVTGSYAIVVDPQGANTGGITLTLT
jgi:subtilisin family serine protease